MGFIQSASHSVNSNANTITFGSATTIGNCLIAMFGAFSGSETVSSVKSGTNADNWAVAASQTTTHSDFIYTDQNSAVSTTTVVITFSVSLLQGGYAVEWSNVATSSAVDQTSTDHGTTGTTWTSLATGTLSQAQEVAFGFATSVAVVAQTLTGPSSPWTNLTQVSASSDDVCIAGYQQVNATTALTYNGTAAQSQTGWGGVIVTLKLSGNIQVNLPVAQINTAAFNVTPPIYVSLPAAAINTAAHNVTPGIAIVVNLPPASVRTSAFNVTPQEPSTLLISIAGRAGVDPYAGTSYPAGFTQFASPANPPGSSYTNIFDSIISFVTRNALTNAEIFQGTQGELALNSGTTSSVTDTATSIFQWSADSPSNPNIGFPFIALLATLVQLNTSASVSIPATPPTVSGADGIAIVNFLTSVGICTLWILVLVWGLFRTLKITSTMR